MTTAFRPMTLDDSPPLLEKSFQLRYQVYCLEREFLPAESYPDQMEIDQFDRNSVHVGVIDSGGELAGTARLVRDNGAGLPLLQHCTLFPHVTAINDAGNTTLEVSRVSISRHYTRRREDPPFNPGVGSVGDAATSALRVRQRQQHRAEPFITLLKAIIYGAKREGATHLIYATDAALHRWLVHYGFPYVVAGPEVDYYGPVAPYLMSLSALDQAILGREFPALDDFPVGMDPEHWPKPFEHAEVIASPAIEAARLVQQ